MRMGHKTSEINEKRRMKKESKATGIKTWPEDDRPREKLLSFKRSLIYDHKF